MDLSDDFSKEITMKDTKALLLASAVSAFMTSSYIIAGGTASSHPMPTLAPASCSQTNVSDRFAGVSLGVHSGFIHASTRSHYRYTNPMVYPGYGGKETISGTGGFIGAHGAFGYISTKSLYLGAEVTAGRNFIKGNARDEIFGDKRVAYQQKDTYSMDLRLGIAGESLVYIKAGGILTRRGFDARYLNLATVSDYRALRYIPGLLLGVGAEIPITDTYSMGVETEYVKYKRDKIVHSDIANYIVNNNTFAMKIKLSIKI